VNRSQPHQRLHALGTDVPGLTKLLLGIVQARDLDVGSATQRQHPGAGWAHETIRFGRLEKLSETLLLKQGLAEGERDERWVGAQARGLAKLRLGVSGLALLEVDLTHEYVGRDIAVIELDGVLELDQGTVTVAALETRQGILVEQGGRLSQGRETRAYRGPPDPDRFE
jgi:hypothetical protein